ncbi:MAG: NAD(P)H-binding protein [Firmicutes bacterium]|nr:NAD(P)H-binding protein [Bacillota bacterium]
MKTIVLGATGRLGREVVREFVGAGHQVVAVTRSANPPGNRNALRWVTLDARDVAGHHTLFAHADCVIDARNQRYDDWSGYPAMITATLAALEGTQARYVYVDNLYLYGRPPSSDAVDETAPRMPVSEKGRIRCDIEAQLQVAMRDHAIVIVRFPDFYGITTDPLPRALRWFGPPTLAHQFIHVPDAAHAVRLLAEELAAYGDIWHVTGAEPITGDALRDITQQVVGRPVRLHVIGPALVHLMGLVYGPARGLRETQYLWQTPVTLSMAKFASRFDTRFIHSHVNALREIVQKTGGTSQAINSSAAFMEIGQ